MRMPLDGFHGRCEVSAGDAAVAGKRMRDRYSPSDSARLPVATIIEIFLRYRLHFNSFHDVLLSLRD